MSSPTAEHLILKRSPLSKKARLILLMMGLVFVASTFVTTRQFFKIWNSKYAIFVDGQGRVILDFWFLAENRGQIPRDTGAEVLSVDGEPLDGNPHTKGHDFFKKIQDLPGETVRIRLRLSPSGQEIDVVRKLRRIGFAETWLLYWNYVAAGVVMCWSSVLLVYLAARRIAAGSYAFSCLFLYIFGTSLLDYLTWGEHKLLFFLGWLAAILSPIWLMITFPTEPEKLRPRMRWFMGGLLIMWLVGAFYLHLYEGAAAKFNSYLVIGQGSSLIGVMVIYGLRTFRATRQRRRELKNTLFGFLSLIVLGFALLFTNSDVTLKKLLLLAGIPFCCVLVPLSLGYWLIRHNILHISITYSQRRLLLPAPMVALMIAGTPLVLKRLYEQPKQPSILLDLILFISVFLLSWHTLHRLILYLYFPATRAFRPAIARLGEVLADLPKGMDGRLVIERISKRFLPTMDVEVMNRSALSKHISLIHPKTLERLKDGYLVQTQEEEPRLRVPMRLQGELQGVLFAHGGIYNDDDLSLLQNVASLGAVILYATEEARGKERRVVSTLAQSNRITIATFIEQTVHEMGPPIAFFDLVLNRIRQGRELDAEFLVAFEQCIDRLRCLVDCLRNPRMPQPDKKWVPLHSYASLVCTVNEELIETRDLEPLIEIEPAILVHADHEMLYSILNNLFKNAAEAVRDRGRIGIRADRQLERIELVVWDDGPGLSDEVAQRFEKGEYIKTTKANGTGLGMMCYRIYAQAQGWQVLYKREGERTCFVVNIPINTQPEPATKEGSKE